MEASATDPTLPDEAAEAGSDNGPEKAVERIWQEQQKQWVTRETNVLIAPKWFEKGTMRAAFKMKFVDDQVRGNQMYVAKLTLKAKDRTSSVQYEKDCKMQMIAVDYAKKYNMLNPPKKVEFLDAFLIQLVEREGQPIVAVEAFVTGSYVKYNNNLDWTEEKRNTPQAFSHWTYIQSEKQLMIVDIQGVGDVWTDPQFHTSYPTTDFGKGNLEQMGIDGFFKAHKCNSICEFLGIGKDSKVGVGTMAPARSVHHSAGGFKTAAASIDSSIDTSAHVDVVIKKSDEKKCCVCQ